MTDGELRELCKKEIELGDSGTVLSILEGVAEATSVDYLEDCVALLRQFQYRRQP